MWGVARPDSPSWPACQPPVRQVRRRPASIGRSRTGARLTFKLMRRRETTYRGRQIASFRTMIESAHDLADEDIDLRSSLAALGPDALRELQDVLTRPEPSRDALLRSLLARPGTEALAQLIAISDTD